MGCPVGGACRRAMVFPIERQFSPPNTSCRLVEARSLHEPPRDNDSIGPRWQQRIISLHVTLEASNRPSSHSFLQPSQQKLKLNPSPRFHQNPTAVEMEASRCVPGRIPRISGTVFRHDSSDRSRSVSARPRRAYVGGGGFSDDGHLKYYVSTARCGGKAKGVERRMKLVKDLTRDLSVLMCVEKNKVGLVRETGKDAMISDSSIQQAAQVLLSQLEKLRADEKVMKKRKKEQKAMKKRKKEEKAMNKMKDCQEGNMSSSSSESSESCDCDSTEVVDMNSLRNDVLVDATSGNVPESGTNLQPLQQKLDKMEYAIAKEKVMKKSKEKKEKSMKKMKDCQEGSSSSSESSESSDSDCEEVVDMGTLKTGALQGGISDGVVCTASVAEKETNVQRLGHGSNTVETLGSLKCVTECSSSSIVDTTDYYTNMAAAGTTAKTVPNDRIEVCMGGKCKKSGALQLKEEFEKLVCAEGAVVGCKCMGKCKEGPNVRIMNLSSEGEVLTPPPRNPLCIGVGLEDVGTIVSTYFGKKDMGFLGA